MRKQITAVIVVIGALALAPALADDALWGGGSGDWNSANWDTGVPIAGDFAIINNGGTNVTVSGTEAVYNLYIGVNRDPAADTNTGVVESSYNTVTVTGTLNVGNRIFLSQCGTTGPVALGDYNQLIIEDGGTVNTGGSRIGSGTIPGYNQVPQVAIHNRIQVNTGGTLNAGTAYAAASVFMYDGDLVVNGGTVYSPGMVRAWSQATQVPMSTYGGMLIADGLMDVQDLGTGYTSMIYIGDGVGAQGSAIVELGNQFVGGETGSMNAWGGYYGGTAYWAGRGFCVNPYDSYDDPNAARYGVGTPVVVKSDGRMTGNGYIYPSTDGQTTWRMLVESGGMIDPGDRDNTGVGQYNYLALAFDGGVEWASGGILNIDLFGNGNSDYFGQYGTTSFIKINSGAILNVEAPNGYTPIPYADSWQFLDWNTRTGTFTVVNDTGYAGLFLDVAYNDTAKTATLSATAVEGDADLDGIVSGGDYDYLYANWGAGPGMTWLDGDWDGDGYVGGGDYDWLYANWGYGVGGGGSVPEPATLALLGLGAVAIIRRRR